MNTSNENFHFDEIIKENIYIAKYLYNLPENKKREVRKLLLKKEKIKQKNGLFAELRIDKINKKISKIREGYNEKK